jgi:citrate:succinate antiporter/L-tartrate/succinate antiporter
MGGRRATPRNWRAWGRRSGLILLVSFFFWVHYFFSSITSHAAAVLPVVLAVGHSIPGLSMPTLTLLCVYSLGLMGVISPYATGPAPMYYGSGYYREGRFLEVRA